MVNQAATSGKEDAMLCRGEFRRVTSCEAVTRPRSKRTRWRMGRMSGREVLGCPWSWSWEMSALLVSKDQAAHVKFHLEELEPDASQDVRLVLLQR